MSIWAAWAAGGSASAQSGGSVVVVASTSSAGADTSTCEPEVPVQAASSSIVATTMAATAERDPVVDVVVPGIAATLVVRPTTGDMGPGPRRPLGAGRLARCRPARIP